MSLPWVLTEHVLRQRNTPLMPLLLAPLGVCDCGATAGREGLPEGTRDHPRVGVYNCCADAALRQHKQQHLHAVTEGEQL